MRFAFLLPFLMTFGSASGQSSTATYRVTFVSTWSASTHPDGFPGNPHFSGLVGATHDSTVRFWTVGELASQGIKDMAERGSKTALLAEVAAAGLSVGTPLSGGGIGLSPGEISLTFDIDETRPLVTLVSMLAPSPDWFVGVTNLDLRLGSGWSPGLEVELHVYDAGTDSGPDYTSPDADMVPRAVVAPLTSPPFHVETRVGTFLFERIASTAIEDDVPSPTTLGAPWPNPASDRFTVAVSGSQERTGTLSLYDLLGRVVATRRFEPGRVTFDVSTLPAGLYLLRSQDAVVRPVIVRR